MRPPSIDLPCTLRVPSAPVTAEVPWPGPERSLLMRRTARWSVAALLMVAGLLMGASPGVLAQDPAGPEVQFLDDEGVARGIIQIVELHDPFEDSDPARPAAAGQRYVGLIGRFTAADDQTFDTNPYYIVARDTNGYLYTPSYVPRPADVIVPDLQSQTLAPGNRISGFIGYILPADAVLQDVLYLPSSYRSIPLVQIGAAAGPPIGGSIPFTATDGSQATITLQVTDPVTGTVSTPAEGMRYVGLDVVWENTGALVYDAQPTELYLRTADGDLYYPTGLTREDTTVVPDLAAQPLAPGDRISGFLGYSVPTDATVVAVDYWPESGRRAMIGDLVGDGPVPTAGPVVTPEPAASVTPPPPAASPTPGQSAGVSQ